MLYHLSLWLRDYWTIFNVVHYVSFRAMAGLLTAVLLSFYLGAWFMRRFGNLLKQATRPDLPERHRLKGQVPTMGGLLIITNVLGAALLWSNWYDLHVWIFILGLISFGAIGLWDDYRKLRYRLGISAKTKFSLQLIAAGLVVLCWMNWLQPSTELFFPFFKSFHPDLGYFFGVWAVFVILAAVNATNLTDGLDGLATGTLLPCFAAFGIVAYAAGHFQLAGYLQIPFAGTAEVAILAAILVGAALGFLWYNTHPAELFMGDVGSLALGAALALLGLMTKQELLLVIAGGLLVLETVSVIAQVCSYRWRGKRIFRMAPLHHHFELQGWPESKITTRFVIIAILLSLVALMTLKIR